MIIFLGVAEPAVVLVQLTHAQRTAKSIERPNGEKAGFFSAEELGVEMRSRLRQLRRVGAARDLARVDVHVER